MRIEWYFDFSCPYAYIGTTQIERIAAAHGAELVWRPMLLGGVFRSIARPGESGDGPMATLPPPKARHNAADMMRWADYYDVPLAMPPGHPMRTVGALRALLQLPEARWPEVIHALYRAYWIDGKQPSAPETLRELLRPDELDSALAAASDPAIKAELRRRTDEAVARGVFGAPTAFVSGDDIAESDALMFWGQDRLHMIDAVLGGWRPGSGPPPKLELPAADGQRRTVEFWYDISSPFAYLGSTQIEEVCQRTGAELIWRPMLLGGIFKELGIPNVPMFAVPENKTKYYARELDYWSSYWQVPFRFTSRFPVRTITALRLLLQAGDRVADLTHALFRALWVDDRDLNDEATLRSILGDLELDADRMLAGTRDPVIKQELIARNAQAVAKGVFGAPTCIVDPDGSPMLFWGQDRLELVERSLGGHPPSCG